MSIAAIIAVLAVLGAGASIAAQTSLPGDALYGVKVNVNEEVREAMAFSDEGKASIEADRAEERLKEAEELSVSASVSADVRAQIEANFKAFADRAEARMTAL